MILETNITEIESQKKQKEDVIFKKCNLPDVDFVGFNCLKQAVLFESKLQCLQTIKQKRQR